MQYRRPSGLPNAITANEPTATARVYEEAIIGMIYDPFGYWGDISTTRTVVILYRNEPT
jgi:hypothetical protein